MSYADGMCPHNNFISYCPSCAAGRTLGMGELDFNAVLNKFKEGVTSAGTQALVTGAQGYLTTPDAQEVIKESLLQKAGTEFMRNKWLWLGLIGAAIVGVGVVSYSMAKRKVA